MENKLPFSLNVIKEVLDSSDSNYEVVNQKNRY
jgi:hypothetical protein